jgi:hypothetical protein
MWGMNEFEDGAGGWGDEEETPADEVVRLVAESDGTTARGIATALRYPVEEVEDVLEDLRANGEVEKDADGTWVVPDAVGPDDPYIF